MSLPRFTEQEKEIINSKLLIEGEKLFALHGLKKVTVDDLVAAVNISKGSFYEMCIRDRYRKSPCGR